MSKRENRYRLRGARIEVIVYLLSRESRSVLLVESALAPCWAPPQEGVKVKEGFFDAFQRCLAEECGVDIKPGQKRLFWLRDLRFLGILDLPKERWGERLVAEDAVDSPLDNVELRKKAYWAVIAVSKNSTSIALNPDGHEISDTKWADLDHARQLISSTNRPEKAALLLKGLDACLKHL